VKEICVHDDPLTLIGSFARASRQDTAQALRAAFVNDAFVDDEFSETVGRWRPRLGFVGIRSGASVPLRSEWVGGASSRIQREWLQSGALQAFARG
jgi:hypothetical protein